MPLLPAFQALELRGHYRSLPKFFAAVEELDEFQQATAAPLISTSIVTDQPDPGSEDET